MDFETSAILEYDLLELRKDLSMLRVRIRMQRAVGCVEGVARLQREYQRTAARYHRLLDLATGVEVAA